ncbi:MAG: hypothetical protein R2791_12395 [Saprospiraceae bacterium]
MNSARYSGVSTPAFPSKVTTRHLSPKSELLDKNSAGLEVLGKLYRDKKEYILNQFKIAHDLYKGYQTEDEFVLAYPFVPYQFKLIARSSKHSSNCNLSSRK